MAIQDSDISVIQKKELGMATESAMTVDGGLSGMLGWIGSSRTVLRKMA